MNLQGWRLPVVLAALWVVFLLATALVARWLLPPVEGRVGAVRGVDDPWRLTAPRQSNPDRWLSDVIAGNLWPAPVVAGLPQAPVERPALTPPDWRISGVYTANGQAVAIISVVGQPDRFLRIGDLLPGGARIDGIAADHLAISLSGKRLSLSTLQE